MKSISALGIAAAALLCIAPAAMAATTNFGPANMTGAAPAPESKKIHPVAATAKSSEPGFWQKEAKRSGLADTGGDFKSGVGSLFHIPDWFKKQEDAYKARNPGTVKK